MEVQRDVDSFSYDHGELPRFGIKYVTTCPVCGKFSVACMGEWYFETKVEPYVCEADLVFRCKKDEKAWWGRIEKQYGKKNVIRRVFYAFCGEHSLMDLYLAHHPHKRPRTVCERVAA